MKGVMNHAPTAFSPQALIQRPHIVSMKIKGDACPNRKFVALYFLRLIKSQFHIVIKRPIYLCWCDAYPRIDNNIKSDIINGTL
jgi:hypothetical protein